MLKGFDEETAPLSEYEKNELLPLLIRGLSARVGAEHIITNAKMIEGLRKNMNIKISQSRIRKLINHIRINGLIPCLIASNRGYYIATTSAEIEEYENSLIGRIEAEQAVLKAIRAQRTIIFG